MGVGFTALLLLTLFPKHHLPAALTQPAFKTSPRASLVVQWLRICLAKQGTRVRFQVVTKVPTHLRATTSPHALEPESRR